MIGLENTDLNELEKFSSRANSWWSLDGEFRTLHEINPARLKFITKKINLQGKNVLDIGCGGGILSESLAKEGAIVTAIDASEENIRVASKHASDNELNINYLTINAEKISEENINKFDLITCMELLEHVPNPLSIIESSSKMIKPGGHIIFSTINRNIKAYILAIITGEYILKLLPKNTHSYEKFIRPSELVSWCNRFKLKTNELCGIKYFPLLKTSILTKNLDVNYILDVTSND